MVVIKKNQIIVTALLIVIAIAGYISYTDQSTMDYANQFGEIEEGVAIEEVNSQNQENLGDAIFTSISSDQKVDENTEKEDQDAKKEESKKEDSKKEDSNKNSEDEQALNSEEDYFVVGKLMREKQYQSNVEQKTSILKDNNVSSADKQQVHAVIATIDKNYQTAVEIETLLKGRGYDPTLVTFGANGKVNVDVGVKGKKLDKKDVISIKKVVMMQVDTTEDKIYIHPMQ